MIRINGAFERSGWLESTTISIFLRKYGKISTPWLAFQNSRSIMKTNNLRHNIDKSVENLFNDTIKNKT